MQRTRFVLLMLLALILGALISLMDSSPGWDDTGVSAAMVLTASGLLGALHPERAWVWALAVGSWIPLLGIALGHGYESVVALAFALAGAYIGAFAGRFLGGVDNAAKEHRLFTEMSRRVFSEVVIEDHFP